MKSPVPVIIEASETSSFSYLIYSGKHRKIIRLCLYDKATGKPNPE
ncbi:MAG TPA: hypothetical protein VN278_03040 [Methanosarcina sp.]|nr:hypothetical protein [Methanosarcina sp.]